MSKKYVDVNLVKDALLGWDEDPSDEDLEYAIDEIPTADVVEIEILRDWLWEIALNNVGCVFDGDFSIACQDIISRLDGLRRFAQERRDI